MFYYFFLMFLVYVFGDFNDLNIGNRQYGNRLRGVVGSRLQEASNRLSNPVRAILDTVPILAQDTIGRPAREARAAIGGTVADVTVQFQTASTHVADETLRTTQGLTEVAVQYQDKASSRLESSFFKVFGVLFGGAVIYYKLLPYVLETQQEPVENNPIKEFLKTIKKNPEVVFNFKLKPQEGLVSRIASKLKLSPPKRSPSTFKVQDRAKVDNYVSRYLTRHAQNLALPELSLNNEDLNSALIENLQTRLNADILVLNGRSLGIFPEKTLQVISALISYANANSRKLLVLIDHADELLNPPEANVETDLETRLFYKKFNQLRKAGSPNFSMVLFTESLHDSSKTPR